MHMRWLRLGLALTLLGVVSVGSGSVHAQTAPVPVPLWQQWFDALNAGDVPGVLALMTAAAGDEDGAPSQRCAGGCVGMAALALGVTELVADGYWGGIDLSTVQVTGTTVAFDITASGGPPSHRAVTMTHWTMELDGDLIAPACAGSCLRSPTARAALVAPPGPRLGKNTPPRAWAEP